ncbi:transcription factor TFIIA complex subunit Toa1, putative [Talaromyces stipitatus ATCC 10500]|uniref:Transcription initiation factor IIA large subunit n=1 Tax=Talaromyces stipitatus (strain ATCC 10500 / CBS 375.48 / QM 6759 / NRRL 1006) TaxID=441959 RepID=B8M2X7_TALSN|nr:transcription factor TFIIA complex subunit Toa1, putative [Talaromyces stipitatus ATCC 10500]EED22232.1 transcription factor TFIIA complex subunit Toa1, putative [Talaromyces stipitatus ATCC 10500]
MANQQVGTVYDRVIQEVCEASRVDFEEGGVDQQTLEEMRRSWQQKLSSLGVAHFPWDPPLKQSPSPAQSSSQQILPPAATVPSNAPRPTPLPAQPPVTLPPQVPAEHNAGNSTPIIKTEPGLNGQHAGVPAHGGPSGSLDAHALARERAMSNLQSKYGAAAANSVNQLQAQNQAALSLPGQRPQNGHIPNGQDVKPIQQPYPGIAPPQHVAYNHPPQTDGANESDALAQWKAEVANRRELVQRNNGEGDRMLMAQLKMDALRLEGGGLMLPLDEHSSSGLPKRMTSDPAASSAQTDGPGDDEDDEDAINSDLDDPDDLADEDPDADDALGEVMLCTYDKVQRVKNKWKCTLKDGILSTGGKEYVFHKGQGEFEW